MAVLAKLRQSWIFWGNKLCFWGILHVIDHTSSALLYALAIDAKMFLCSKNPFYKFCFWNESFTLSLKNVPWTLKRGGNFQDLYSETLIRGYRRGGNGVVRPGFWLLGRNATLMCAHDRHYHPYPCTPPNFSLSISTLFFHLLMPFLDWDNK